MLVGDPINPTTFNGSLKGHFYCVLSVISGKNPSSVHGPEMWSCDDIKHARREKHNVVPKAGHAHFGSEGKIYGYGLVAKFDKLSPVNRKSYAEYSSRE